MGNIGKLSPPTKNLLTVKEMAKRANLHPETLRRYCRDGKIPFFRYGIPGAYFFDPNDVMPLLLRYHNENK